MATYLERFSKWIQLKIYQLEVTLAVYMFTPVEKTIFYSILFLLTSLTFIATVLYLPQHVSFIIGRAWFYVHGPDGPEFSSSAASEFVKNGARSLLAGAVGTASSATAKAAGAEVTGVVREL
ncbi:hypothetical protein QBC35DRAFT_492460 [Podospora australis]|uniref:Uncharacterized protein n=1 Tax=Podospora australis TaxID=1536484 RepID=A0AAN6WX58_9PEZI|nr:hypothetical protein QBC35DRAFT_492460 [Podospora australis]